MTKDSLGYEDTLFQERTLCSVTANTRMDGEEFLALAERFAIRPDIVTYLMADAPRALSDLAHGGFWGAAGLGGVWGVVWAPGPPGPPRAPHDGVGMSKSPLRNTFTHPAGPSST